MHFSTKTKKNSCPKITQACSAWLCFRPSRHNFELSPICCEAQAIPPAQAYRVNCWPLPKNKKSFFLEKNVPKNCTSWTHSGCVVIMFATPVFFNRKKMLSHAQVARRYHRSNLHRMTPFVKFANHFRFCKFAWRSLGPFARANGEGMSIHGSKTYVRDETLDMPKTKSREDLETLFGMDGFSGTRYH